jgi:gluconate 2-dehydrogenase gamma chain
MSDGHDEARDGASGLSRREFGTGVVGLGVVLGLVSPASAQPINTTPIMTSSKETSERLFFTDEEASFIESVVNRLIPAEGNGPGAVEAGVPNYIDRQLGGAWGAGERLYMGGPYKPDAIPQLGYQLPYAPAEMFRRAIGAIGTHLKTLGRRFADLSADEQDAFIRVQLEGGALGDLDGVPAKTFFEQLLDYTVQGYFSDPAYGGNKDMVVWKAIGFPGAYDVYDTTVEMHGQKFNIGPYSILDHAELPMSDMESMEQQK